MRYILGIILVILFGWAAKYQMKFPSLKDSTTLLSLTGGQEDHLSKPKMIDQNHGPKNFLALNLDKYQALIGERLCDIEVIEEGESIEIHFFDSSGETCDRYEKNRLTHVDMNQVADSTMPLFIKRNDRILPSKEEEPVGLVQVSDLINLVLKNEKHFESVLVYSVGEPKKESL